MQRLFGWRHLSLEWEHFDRESLVDKGTGQLSFYPQIALNKLPQVKWVSKFSILIHLGNVLFLKLLLYKLNISYIVENIRTAKIQIHRTNGASGTYMSNSPSNCHQTTNAKSYVAVLKIENRIPANNQLTTIIIKELINEWLILIKQYLWIKDDLSAT